MATVRIEVWQDLSNFWFAKIMDTETGQSLRDDEQSYGAFYRHDAVNEAKDWAENHGHRVIGVDYT